jgi:hypothetical protein
MRISRSRISRTLVSFVVAVLGAACSSAPPAPPPQRVLQPPVMDLSTLGALGMLEFTSQGEAPLGSVAREQFMAALQSAQPGTPVLELGSVRDVVAEVHGTGLNPATVKAIGEKYQVDALLVADVRSAEMRPSMSLQSISNVASLNAKVELEGALNARILETKRGATIWTTSATGRVPMANLALSTLGMGGLNAGEADQSRLELVKALVTDATVDFQPRWVTQ